MAEKSYFIGIDSDGIAFNSMIPKHRYAFIPATIKVWDLQRYTDTVFEIGERINLYSKHRGINRFPGQLMMFEELREKGIDLGDYSSFKNYVEKSSNYSNSTLKEYMRENPNAFLDKVLEWSTLGDKLFFEAAKSVNALFYPIMPGKEGELWENFLEICSKKFFEGNFAGEYQESLLDEFQNILS